MKLTIDSLGEEIVSRDLLRFGHNATHLEPAMEQILDDVRAKERRQFDSEGGYGSGGWDELAPATVESKRRRGKDNRILREDGDLFDAMTEEGNPDQIAIARHDGLDFGTTLAHGALHQTGTTRMPRRRPAQFPEADRRGWVRIVQREIVNTGPRFGGRLL